MRCPRSTSVLCLLGLVLEVQILSAQDRTNALTLEQVACSERQLERLLERFDLILEPDGPVAGLNPNPAIFVSEGSGAMRFRGSEVRNEPEPHSPQVPDEFVGASDCVDSVERMMGYAIVVQEEQFLLNPERPAIDQILLARIEPQSNLTSIRCPRSLLDTHRIRLGLGRGAEVFSPVLEINNVRAIPAGGISEGATPAASTASRVLREEGMLHRCNEAYTAWDFRTFALLERMIRPYAIFFDGSQRFHDMEVALFRGADPHTYRANVYKIGLDAQGRGVALGRLAVEMVIGWDERGRWTTGSARILPLCGAGQTTGCSTETGLAFVTFYPPLLPDFGLRGDPPNAISVAIGFPGRPSEVTIDWADLLADSVWNRGE